MKQEISTSKEIMVFKYEIFQYQTNIYEPSLIVADPLFSVFLQVSELFSSYESKLSFFLPKTHRRSQIGAHQKRMLKGLFRGKLCS